MHDTTIKKVEADSSPRGIYTKVANPEAGHENEVIPPPDSPGGEKP